MIVYERYSTGSGGCTNGIIILLEETTFNFITCDVDGEGSQRKWGLPMHFSIASTFSQSLWQPRHGFGPYPCVPCPHFLQMTLGFTNREHRLIQSLPSRIFELGIRPCLENGHRLSSKCINLPSVSNHCLLCTLASWHMFLLTFHTAYKGATYSAKHSHQPGVPQPGESI